MTGTCFIHGFIGVLTTQDGSVRTPYTTLLDVVHQVESTKDLSVLNVYLNTPGGLVEEADEIYDYLDRLKQRGVEINTFARNMVYSAGVKIFLIGTNRDIEKGTEIMIHNPWVTLKEGDADVVEEYGKALRRLEKESIDFYNSVTGVSPEALKTLMKKDTYLTEDQALDLGFATSVSEKTKIEAVACSRSFNFNQKSDEMSKQSLTKKEVETMFEKLANSIKQLFSPKQVKFQTDATGEIQIEFPDLEPDDNPGDGDIGYIDGAKAEGEYLMPNGDTYSFTDGVLTIIPKTEESEERIEELTEEVNQLKKELRKKEARIAQMEKENKSEKKTNEELLKKIQHEMVQLKKSISSEFEHESEDGNRHKSRRSNGSRTLFKK